MTKAIVIGAGFGGLALAIRLQAAGHHVQLIEARDQVGGRAYVYRQDGFSFDGGPTVLTDPACLSELFELTGRRMSDYVELIPVDPFYRLIWDDGQRFDYGGADQPLLSEIARLDPKDVEGYRGFYDYSRRVYEEGYLKLGHVAFTDVGKMLKAAPSLMKLKAWRSVYSTIAGYVKNEHLRQALSFHTLLVGGNPFEASSIYALIHALERQGGVWYAKGGTGALVKALERLFLDMGGEVLVSAPVQTILTQGQRATGVKLVDGREFSADLVASNGDVVRTYENLLGHHPRGRQAAARLKRRRFSMSLFVVYFGLEGAPPEDLKHHTILFGPQYRELVDAITKARPLRDGFSLYVHAPSVHDTTVAPAGHSAYYALSPVPNLKQAIDWEREAPRYAQKILDRVEQRLIPGLNARLVTKRYLTPLDFDGALNSHLGAAFSLEPILSQSAYFRVHNRDDQIKNLFFVGAGTHPGAGVPGVVGSAKATAGVIAGTFGGRSHP